ncbi:MAG: hypothetical protein RLZZ283_408 [Candidatus Parcubacteria bacterium]|jgi:hypothetical protein
MIINTWADVLRTSFVNLWSGIIAYLPNIVIAIIIFVIGWIVGTALMKVVEQIFRSLKIDGALKSTGLNDAVERAGFTLNTGMLIGVLVKWFVIVAFLVASLDVLGLDQVNDFIKNVVLFYLPQVIVAALFIIVGAFVAEVAKNIVGGAARAAEVKSANFAGSVVKWAIWIFAILAALGQLQIAPDLINTLFTGIVVAIALALGLSFGLGGQEAAARFIEKTRNEIANHK